MRNQHERFHTKLRKTIDEKINKKLNRVKLIKNIQTSPQSFHGRSDMQKEVLPSSKLLNHALEKQNRPKSREKNTL